MSEFLEDQEDELIEDQDHETETPEEVEEVEEVPVSFDQEKIDELAVSKKANVMFIGKEAQMTHDAGETETEMIDREPPSHINDGMETILLPSSDIQKAGAFYHPNADRIVNLFPSFYKRYI